MMLPILACTERELAICEEEVKMTTCFVFVIEVPLRFEMTTPGIARKLALALATNSFTTSETEKPKRRDRRLN